MNEEWKKEFFEWKDEIESKFNNLSQKHSELGKNQKELEETIVLNTCREIMKPYCPIRIADLAQIEENNKQIEKLKDKMKRSDLYCQGCGTFIENQKCWCYGCMESTKKLFKEAYDLEKLDSPTLPDPYYPCGKEKTEKKEDTIKICPECGSYYKGTHTLTDCNYAKGDDSGGELSVEVNNPMSSRSGMKASITDSKLPETEPEKGLECHGCGVAIITGKYWCYECIESTRRQYEEGYQQAIKELIEKAGDNNGERGRPLVYWKIK